MIETLGNLGDFIGGIAVVITLVYLAIQIRQNTIQLRKGAEIARAEARFTSVQAFSEFRSHLITNPEVASLYYRGGKDIDALSPEDRLRYGLLLQDLFASMHAVMEKMKVSTQEGYSRSYEELNIDLIMSLPGVARWWEDRKARFDPEFVEFIEKSWRAHRQTP